MRGCGGAVGMCGGAVSGGVWRSSEWGGVEGQWVCMEGQ